MKVTVKLVVDVDPAEWVAREGHLDDGTGRYVLAEVRDDIRTYLLNLVQCSAIAEETGATVSLGK